MRRYIFGRLLINIFRLSQSLGVCVCSDSWAGSDCSVPRDSNSLVWETLLDTQLTVVGAEHSYTSTISTLMCTVYEFHTLAHTTIHKHSCFTEPGPQVPPQDGPLPCVWTSGQPLDVWRTLSVRGHSRKYLQVGVTRDCKC